MAFRNDELNSRDIACPCRVMQRCSPQPILAAQAWPTIVNELEHSQIGGLSVGRGVGKGANEPECRHLRVSHWVVDWKLVAGKNFVHFFEPVGFYLGVDQDGCLLYELRCFIVGVLGLLALWVHFLYLFN